MFMVDVLFWRLVTEEWHGVGVRVGMGWVGLGLGLGLGQGSRLRGLWLKVATRGLDACVFAYMQHADVRDLFPN